MVGHVMRHSSHSLVPNPRENEPETGPSMHLRDDGNA